MKRTAKSIISVMLALVFVFAFASCNDKSTAEIWETAKYSEDTELGNGAKTAIVEVKAGDKTVKFTLRTDKDTVGAALMEHDLISGEDGAYGLYVKVVNGITADYDVNQRYWGFYIDGELAMTGVDGTEITEGITYRLEYSK